MTTPMPFAQALAERSLLDAAISGVRAVPAQIDAKFGDGTSTWILIAGACLLAWWLLRPRR